MATKTSLWERSSAWRWTLMLTCLATATVILIGPWHSTIPNSAVLATYNKPSNQAQSHQTQPQQSGFHDPTFDVAVTKMRKGFPQGTELHVIGVYEGALPNGQNEPPWWARCLADKGVPISNPPNPQIASDCHSKYASQRTEKTITITVTRPSVPIVLVLMASDPVKWKIIGNKPVNIQKIILAGNYGQDIDGEIGTIPVDVYTNKSSPCKNCTRQTESFFAYKEDTPEYDQVVSKLKTITGLIPTSFQGAYRSDRFFITNSTARLPVSSMNTGAKIQMDFISGKEFDDRIALADINIPLPEGRWQGIVYSNTPTMRGIDELAVLARTEKNQLEELIGIRVQVVTDGAGFPSQPSCAAKDLLTLNTEINEAYGEQRCYWVNHTTEPWMQPIFALASNQLVSQGIPIPDLLINSAFHKADKNSALTVYYLTNPGTKKINTLQTNWFASPWHPKNIKRFPEKDAYAQNQTKWAKAWFQIFNATK
jgi:hypothetical protein